MPRSTVGSLSAAAKQALFSSFFSPLKPTKQKSDRNRSATAGHGCFLGSTKLPQGAGCTRLKGQPDLAEWSRAAAWGRREASYSQRGLSCCTMLLPVGKQNFPSLFGNKLRCLHVLCANSQELKASFKWFESSDFISRQGKEEGFFRGGCVQQPCSLM